MSNAGIILLLTTIITLVERKAVNAEDEDIYTLYNNNAGNGTRDGTSDDKLGSDEEIFLFFLFSFFAICVSLFGSFLLYVSYLDDRIMKQYADEGDLLEGEVVATEFTRGVDRDFENTGNAYHNSQKEYFVSIEYSYFLSENYPIRIRKQLRVLEGDFSHPNITDRGNGNSTVPTNIIEIIASRDSFFKSFQFDHGRKLELLVLGEHHLSALPARQVERRLSIRYRLFSVSFVLAAISIAVFCFRLAAPLLQQQICGEIEDGGCWLSIIADSFSINLVFIFITLAPLPCIHHLLHELIQQSLEGEYFEMGGEIIKGGQDDSSLSSRSDFGYNRMDLETQSTLT